MHYKLTIKIHEKVFFCFFKIYLKKQSGWFFSVMWLSYRLQQFKPTWSWVGQNIGYLYWIFFHAGNQTTSNIHCVWRRFTHPSAGHRIRPALGSPTSFGHGFSSSYSPCAPECGTVASSWYVGRSLKEIRIITVLLYFVFTEVGCRYTTVNYS